LLDEVCDDKLDNDFDRLVDCRDPECLGETGADGGVCEMSETSCEDGSDNDGDTNVDCDDRDCSNDLACRPGIDPV
jgi:hypothetical protein